MNYEDFFTADDVATYKRVKLGTMRIAATARDVLASLVDGQVSDRGKEFLTTRRGLYRIAMSDNSDNTTERAAHDRMGATTVALSDDERLDEFFAVHGVDPDPARRTLVRRIKDAFVE